jgi:hypothetical protein
MPRDRTSPPVEGTVAAPAATAGCAGGTASCCREWGCSDLLFPAGFFCPVESELYRRCGRNDLGFIGRRGVAEVWALEMGPN